MSSGWWSDQSNYNPLLICSAIQEEAVGQEFVLKRGMIGLDYEEHLFSIPVSGPITEAAFLHLVGNALWKERAKEIMTNLTWFYKFASKEFINQNLTSFKLM